MTQTFFTEKTETVTKRISKSKEEIKAQLLQDQPKQIFNHFWSSDKPTMVIQSITEEGVTYYNSGAADKTPALSTWDKFLSCLQMTGINQYYYETV